MADHYNTSYHPEISFSTLFPHLDSAHGIEPSMLSQLDTSYDDRDWDSAVQNGFNLMPYPDSSSTASPSSVTASAECPGSCSPPFPISDSLHPASPQTRTRKTFKDRPRIDLAPDQPPTTQGRPRARVFVACVQWYAPSPHRYLTVFTSFRVAVGARSVVMAPSRSATTVLGVKGMKSALTMLYQSVVGLIGPRERALLAQGRRSMRDLSQGASVAVSQLLTGQARPLRSSHVSPPIRRYSMLSLPIHSNMRSAFEHRIPDSNPWKAWQGSVRPPVIRRCLLLTLQVPDTL